MGSPCWSETKTSLVLRDLPCLRQRESSTCLFCILFLHELICSRTVQRDKAHQPWHCARATQSSPNLEDSKAWCRHNAVTFQWNLELSVSTRLPLQFLSFPVLFPSCTGLYMARTQGKIQTIYAVDFPNVQQIMLSKSASSTLLNSQFV